MSKPLFERGDRSLLWRDGALELTACAGPPQAERQAFASLIARTEFGEGGMRYRRLDVDRSLESLGRDVAYVRLVRADTLVGTYLLRRHTLLVHDRPILGVYRSSLCLNASMKGKGLGTRIVQQTLSWLDGLAARNGESFVSYGCVERANQPSMGALSAHTTSIGTLRTQLVYRQWPRATLALTELDADDPRVIQAQAQTYDDCGVRVASDAPFLAKVEDGQIVAGAQARLVRIDFSRIGQPWDFLSKHVFAYASPARRRFDPHDFRYVQLDNAVVLPGFEAVWKPLLATFMARANTHMAMLTLDPTCQASSRLAPCISGYFARATQQHVSVLARAHGRVPGFDQLATAPLGLNPR
ncbi:MAG: hypothetical protein AAF465_02480 [Pseudomonadota bacterium]